MTFGYGRLVARVYELDKPVGTSFGDIEFYLEHWYGLDEFRRMLADAGFTTVTVCGDYQPGAAPQRGSRAWTFEAS